jgi:hypothetical protein
MGKSPEHGDAKRPDLKNTVYFTTNRHTNAVRRLEKQAEGGFSKASGGGVTLP